MKTLFFLLLFPLVLLAQPRQMLLNRPAVSSGVAGGYSPATDGNVFEWLKADAISQGSGTTVSTWTASAGVNLSQSTSANQPTYYTSIQNGLPAVEFPNTSSSSIYLSTAGTHFGPMSYPYTVFIVFNEVSYITGNDDIIAADSTGNDVEFYDSYTSWAAFNNGTASLPSVGYNGWHIISLIFEGNYSATMYRLDGGSYTSGTGGGGGSGGIINSLSLGYDALNARRPCNVDVGEVIIYNGDQSGNAAAIFGYLDGRWAVY